MASNFWDGSFYFNGIHSSNYEVCIVDFDEKNIIKQHGHNFNIELNKEVSSNYNFIYNENEVTSENITIQLCKTNNSKWTESDLLGINKWLFTKNFKKFQTLDYDTNTFNIVYYLKAVSMKKFLTSQMEGYIEIEFALYEPYCYIIPPTTCTLNGTSNKILYSYSNLYDTYKPIIKIINNGDENEIITIKNTDIENEGLIIKGMNNGENIIIDCKIGSVLNGNKVNRFDVLQNYNFIELISGYNHIELTGNAKIEIICEFPVIL